MKKTSFTLSILLFLAANASGADKPSSFTLPTVRRSTVLRKSYWEKPGYRTVKEGDKGPSILITCPPEEEKVTRYDTIRLSGCLDPETSFLKINGNPVPVNPTGSFVHLHPLEMGKNLITLQASGGGGETEYTIKLNREELTPYRVDFKEFRRPRTGRVTKPHTPLQSLPGGTRIMTLGEGTILKITGRGDDYLQVELSAAITGCVLKENVEWEENYPDQPFPLGNVVVEPEKSRARFSAPAFVPARVDYVSPDNLKLIFYNSVIDTETINLSDWEGDCRWELASNGQAVFSLAGPLSCHRWSLAYADNSYILSWEDRPRKKEEAVVLVDAGHGGEKPGAVSPLGIDEKEANLFLARQLAVDLQEKGVKCVLSRSGDSSLDPYERVEIARKEKADILVSLHHNSLAENEDPREKSGCSVFYYNPPSRELACVIYRHLKKLGLPGNGALWKSLAVTRPTDLIAVLVEVSYLTNPVDEARLLDPEFRRRASGAVASAIVEYLETGND